MPNDRSHFKLAYVERLIDTLSTINRAEVRRYVEARRAEGLKATSLQNIAVALRTLDTDHPGRPLPSLTPDELSRSLLTYTAKHAPASAQSWAGVVRSYYRHRYDGELPREMARALKRKHKEEWREVRPISEEERDALLKAADDTP